MCYATPDAQTLIELQLHSGATVADALAAVAMSEPFASLDLREIVVGVFGERVNRQYPLKDGDRVELYRTLVMDPKEARRRRAGGARGN